MHLREYLAQDGSLTVAAIRQRMNELGADVKDDAQIRQWASEPKEGRPVRRPDAANCRYLEMATKGVVKRADMRPDDYAAIWPELLKAERASARATARSEAKAA
jgi:DNA-binding transcriptional regulator YdaS (Cro superfamily)